MGRGCYNFPMTEIATAPVNVLAGQPQGLSVTTQITTIAARDVQLGDVARLRAGHFREVVGVIRGDSSQTIADVAAAVDLDLMDLLETQLQPGLGMIDWPYVCLEENIEVGVDEVLLISWYAPFPGHDDIQWVANRLHLDALVDVRDRVIDLTR